MRTVFKYPLSMGGTLLEIPKSAKALRFDFENRTSPCLLIELLTDDPCVTRRFDIFGNGHPLPEGLCSYVGTCLQPPFVWHCYEVEP